MVKFIVTSPFTAAMLSDWKMLAGDDCPLQKLTVVAAMSSTTRVPHWGFSRPWIESGDMQTRRMIASNGLREIQL